MSRGGIFDRSDFSATFFDFNTVENIPSCSVPQSAIFEMVILVKMGETVSEMEKRVKSGKSSQYL